MRIWFDTEFIEDGRTIDLISIGLVREDGAKLYLENADVDLSRANDFVRQHVIPHLIGGDAIATPNEMRRLILDFCGPDPDFYAWFAAYDWVVLCQLFGRMVDLPSTWPMRANDVAQLAQHVGANKLPQQAVRHHALADAEHCRTVHLWLESLYPAARAA